MYSSLIGYPLCVYIQCMCIYRARGVECLCTKVLLVCTNCWDSFTVLYLVSVYVGELGVGITNLRVYVCMYVCMFVRMYLSVCLYDGVCTGATRLVCVCVRTYQSYAVILRSTFLFSSTACRQLARPDYLNFESLTD